jgi:hypothetical protein
VWSWKYACNRELKTCLQVERATFHISLLLRCAEKGETCERGTWKKLSSRFRRIQCVVRESGERGWGKGGLVDGPSWGLEAPLQRWVYTRDIESRDQPRSTAIS